MRKLVVGTFVTLDGVMQAPGGPNEDRDGGFRHGGWLVPYFDEKLVEVMTEWTKRAGAFVLGRKTDEIFAASWPKSTDSADEIANALNTRPKFVASSTEQLRSAQATGAALHVYERAGDLKYGEVEVGQETVIFDSGGSMST
jgi:dihydrofolate reductase